MELKIARLFGLLLVAVLVTYFTSELISSIFFVSVVIAYLYSKEEGFWLTFFLVISDGFLGFFNNYDAVVSIIPGLPPVEVGHLYILCTGLKLLRKDHGHVRLFYAGYLGILCVYVFFLVIQGYVIGVSPEMKVNFRIVKFLLPLLLFYTIPRLFSEERQYREAFEYFLPFAFVALFAQIFTLTTSLAPSQALGVQRDLWFTDVFEKGHTYRGFYSVKMVLISSFGALYYLTVGAASMNRIILVAALAANFLSAFLSATRGWVLFFVTILLIHFIVIVGVKPLRIMSIFLVGAMVLFGMKSIPVLDKQLTSATDRVLTMEQLVAGDVTAGGTLERLDRRAPRVMNKWAGSPLTGWGFSDDFFEYSDSHVGNHNVLLHAGIIGGLLLAGFLGYFAYSMTTQAFALSPDHLLKKGLLVFPIFLLGWFIIHSSSGQQFQFYGEPDGAIVQALFFSFGAFVHARSLDHGANGIVHSPDQRAI